MSNTARAFVFLLTLSTGVGIGWALAQGKADRQPPVPRNLLELEQDQALYGELRGLLLEPETLTRVALLSAKLSEMGTLSL